VSQYDDMKKHCKFDFEDKATRDEDCFEGGEYKATGYSWFP